MKERPILFSAPMVTAISEGRKSCTRRVIKPQPPRPVEKQHCYPSVGIWICKIGDDKERALKCPYGHNGDRLWVRHSFWLHNNKHQAWDELPGSYERFSDGEKYDTSSAPCHAWLKEEWKQKPGIHMPRWASRLTLEICEVRAQRVQEISEEDAIAEGVFAWRDTWTTPKAAGTNWLKSMQHLSIESIPIRLFATLWDSINGKTYPWEANPYVWALTFRKVAQP